MKLRYFYKIDQNKNPVLASNIRRKSKPLGKFWRELTNACCDPQDIACTCDPRYFVQVDPRGNPIDYTIIKRNNPPTTKEVGIHYMEIQSSKNVCCGEISWNFTVDGITGTLIITENGVERVNSASTEIGSFKPIHGSTIEITVDNDCEATPSTLLAVVNGETYTNPDETLDTVTHSFVFNGVKSYGISASITCLP